MATLTTANSTIIISIPGLYPAPVQLQGYGTDDAWATEPLSTAQTLMGIDGFLSGGYTPAEKRISFTFQGDSPSVEIFDVWFSTQEATLESYIANMTIVIPGLFRAYDLVRGFLTGYAAVSDGRRVLQPRRFTTTWQSIFSQPM